MFSGNWFILCRLTVPFVFLRLHSIVWVDFGTGADGTGGRLIGGSENGAITVYNPEAITGSGEEAVVGQSDKHTGPVRALDFNPFQVNVRSLILSLEKDVTGTVVPMFLSLVSLSE